MFVPPRFSTQGFVFEARSSLVFTGAKSPTTSRGLIQGGLEALRRLGEERQRQHFAGLDDQFEKAGPLGSLWQLVELVGGALGVFVLDWPGVELSRCL